MFFSLRTVPPYLRLQVENLAHRELRGRKRATWAPWQRDGKKDEERDRDRRFKRNKGRRED